MTWARVDTSILRHPKMLEVPKWVRWMYVESILLAAEHGTDGSLTHRACARMTRRWRIGGALLVQAGLWEDTPEGYRIHDFLEYQPSKKRAKETSEVRAAAGATGGRRSGEVRRERAEARKQANEPRTDGRTDGRNKETCTADAAHPPRGGPAADAPASSSRNGEEALKKKPAPKVHPDRRAVMDKFQAAYLSATGQKPTWGGKQLNLANTLAKHGSLDVLDQRLKCCYVDRKPKWLFSDGTVPDLGSFVSKFDTFVDATPKEDQRYESFEKLMERTNAENQ